MLESYRYGYVTPEDVPEILDQHIEKGIVIERIWRFVFWHYTCIVDLYFLCRCCQCVHYLWVNYTRGPYTMLV